MSLDEVKQRFAEELKLRPHENRYVDKNEEREILQIAIQRGMCSDSARQALAEVCEHDGCTLESSILRQIKEELAQAAGTDGKVDQRVFGLIFDSAKSRMDGKKSDHDIKKMIVTIMEDNGLNKVKTGWSSN